MGTKERLEILKDKISEGKVSTVAYFRTDVGSTTLYTQEYVNEKDKTINELLKRISELEFEVEERDRRIDKAIEYIENSMSGSWSLNEEYEVVSMNKKQILSILKGEDKE